MSLVLTANRQKANITVKDTGIGIPSEHLPHLFERFYRGTAGHERAEGLGLGLALVKAIVDAHEGRIAVESTPGAGTRFVITLP